MFFWSVFFRISTKLGDLLRKFPYSVQIWENTDQKKLRIWTFFWQCSLRENLKNRREFWVNFSCFLIEDTLYLPSQKYLNRVPIFLVKTLKDLKFDCVLKYTISTLSQNRVMSVFEEIIRHLKHENCEQNVYSSGASLYTIRIDLSISIHQNTNPSNIESIKFK